MNNKQIQFNHPHVASFLLAGLILALAAGLTWVGADASGSTFQPAKMVQSGASLQTIHTEPVAADVDCPGADFSERESGLLPWSHLKSAKGSKLGVGSDGASLRGCENGLLTWFHLRSIKGSKLGSGTDGRGQF